jgi:tRNA threonylcarbamoyladenosine biosynthesis protein TsaB
MDRPLILHIETSARLCSVALSEGQEILDYSEHRGEGYVHAEKLHPLVQRVMMQQQKSWKQLQAVAISAGPGSYTGLRIGLSAAKGWCAALSIPLIAVHTLEMLLVDAMQMRPDYDEYVAMVDARRNDVFLQSMDAQKNRTNVRFVTLHEAFFSKTKGTVLVVGDGAAKVTHVESVTIHADIVPKANKMPSLAFDAWMRSDFVDLAYFEPFYFKEFVTGPLSAQPTGDLDYL